ncbi:hypothetical protein BOX15_Mlig020298g1 [Macrostomum lignano]|uniref:ERCC1-like central domain-containing protein n=2 Tax=Macrostomum lignano TaxID=282301 RepID=A0A267DNA9_9PLAT|nr:hypothetical protein BOX15_Mlig026289g2 [Macrostomum lignano]PAA72105.1 hypothetical protein BOX15_Mlig020298g1 [Macrostomum lignano]
MSLPPKCTLSDNVAPDNGFKTDENLSKKPRVQIDIAIIGDDNDGRDEISDSNGGNGVAKWRSNPNGDAEFTPGAIFAATRAEGAKSASAGSIGTECGPSSTDCTSAGNKDPEPSKTSSASTLPKAHPLPGVIKVAAQQLQQEQKDQQQQQQLQQQRILVNNRQRGNPLLPLIRSVPWEYSDLADPADFVLGRTACALFLSVRYHCLHPDYVHRRLKQLGPKDYDLRILLLLVDTQEYSDSVRELNRICLLAGSTLILAWSNEEAARYLESFKSLEKKPADSLMERSAEDWPGQLRDVLGCVRGVSRTDAACLAANFGTFEAMVGASSAELERCPGLGPKKAARLTAVFGQNFAD